MLRRLDFLILVVTGTISLITVLIIVLVLFTSLQRTIEETVLKQVEGIARETFSDMYQVMRRGWKREELLEFLKGVEEAHEGSGIKVRIYRGDKVKELFGAIEEPPKKPVVKKVFTEGKEVFVREDKVLYYVWPIKAQEECLRCHINAKIGDTLGVVEVEVYAEKLFSTIKESVLHVILFSIPLPIIGALFVTLVLKKRIEKSLSRFDNTVIHINSVSDLNSINIKEFDFGFEEINRIRNSLGKLIKRMNKIAVDKDILEFEIKLLEKFIITSEAITNWDSFLKEILSEVSKILNYTYFYVAFKEDEDRYVVHIFWNCICERERECKAELERTISENLRGTRLYTGEGEIVYEHREISEDAVLRECNIRRIRSFTKELSLEEPVIGGLVGIGISREEVESEVKTLAVKGLLATILNIIGSIRAINKYTQELEHFATRDPLTNLYNQRVFWELLDYEIERAKRHNYKFSLFVIDIDNFKLINDTYGHDFGDDFLRKVARILKDIFRKEDIVARYGGDEFVVILPYASAEESVLIARRLLEVFGKSSLRAPDGKLVKITASIGIAVFPDHAENSRDLFILADNMMYKAKAEGKNRFTIVTEEELEEVQRGHTSKGLMILEALEKRRIVPFFQPILNLQNGKVEMYEVLMRIEHEGRIVPAAEFIGIAEDIGVIQKLDCLLMEEALEKVKEAKCEPILFFNLSPKEIILEEFIGQIKELVLRANYNIDKVVFEITERETVRKLETLRKFVENLKAEGFRFAVDDFGSGFASFTYLKFFPIDFVKIEGDFVRSMLTSRIDKAFVESAVAMAKALGVKTIAEYIEDEKIFQAVKEAEVDYAQGFYLGKPSVNICVEKV